MIATTPAFDCIKVSYNRAAIAQQAELIVCLLLSKVMGHMKHVNANICVGTVISIAAWLAAGSVNAANVEQQNLLVEKVRAVGNFEGTVADNTVELWFSTPLSWPAGSRCTDIRRVYIDAGNRHLIAAAYLALTSGKMVTINTDDNLPVRAGGACEISYIDVHR